MIKNVNQDDGLEEVKVKLNEVINILVWDNPMATVEKVAQQHLVSHNREIASTRNDLKKTLIEVQEALEKINQSVKDQSIFKTSIEKDQSEFKKSITEITDTLQHKIKQFITFYAQVGLHVKELCDGKK